MATVSVMRANVRDFADVDASDVSDAFITRALNSAYQDMLGDEPWPFLIARGSLTTVAGVAEYAVSPIAADIEGQRIQRVQQGGVDLHFIGPEQYYSRNALGANVGSTGGTSRFWSLLEGVTLALWPPPPAGTARVIYVKKAPDLTLDGDVPLTPTRYDSILEAGALVYVYQKIGDFDSGTVKQKEFSSSVLSARADLLATQQTSPLVYGGADDPKGLQPARWPWDEV